VSHTSREEDGLRIFENGAEEDILGAKERVIGALSKSHVEELHDLYASPNIVQVIKSRRVRWIGLCGMHGRGDKCVQGFGEVTRKRTTSKTWCRWEDYTVDLI
jgi:hypothetical protein